MDAATECAYVIRDYYKPLGVSETVLRRMFDACTDDVAGYYLTGKDRERAESWLRKRSR